MQKIILLETPSMSLLFEKYIIDLSEKLGLTVLSAMYNFCWEKYWISDKNDILINNECLCLSNWEKNDFEFFIVIFW